MPVPLSVSAPVHGEEPTAFRNHWIETIRYRFANDADRIALRSSKGAITYGDLGRRVAGLAAMLEQSGIGMSDQVGVGLHRGPDLIIALLAVNQRGASYIPIDPGYPSERIRQMSEIDPRRQVVVLRPTRSGNPEM
jgi:acyl-CoA synthetase (AMP-forming)/AMP-acid ligase II